MCLSNVIEELSTSDILIGNAKSSVDERTTSFSCDLNKT